MGVIAEGILRGSQGLFTPVSLGYPLSVFNKNSTLRERKKEDWRLGEEWWNQPREWHTVNHTVTRFCALLRAGICVMSLTLSVAVCTSTDGGYRT